VTEDYQNGILRFFGSRGDGFFKSQVRVLSGYIDGVADFNQDGKLDYVTVGQEFVQAHLNVSSIVTGKLFQDTNGNRIQDPGDPRWSARSSMTTG
jgi:hypothetical protein